MKTGDLVMTKTPGFGTGKKSKIGTVVKEIFFAHSSDAEMVVVMHDDGTFHKWYTWQLSLILGS